jgi:NAD(P)-dependent dehydrogenase (short-subunit alcohol dehydrogenase family)
MIPSLINLFRLPFKLGWYFFESYSYVDIVPNQNVIVITGCDTGFGNSAAIRLQKMGFIVIAACLTEIGVEGLKDKVSLAVQCDLTNLNDIIRLREATENIISSNPQFRLWAIINNAGIGSGGFIDWLSVETCRKCMEVNFFGVITVTKQFLALLKETRFSRIINLSSMAGLCGGPTGGIYSASKHAIEGLTKCLKTELAPWNIHVCNINPSFMRTPIIENSFIANTKEYEKAPIEITKQYDIKNVRCFDELVQLSTENPEMVVDRIIHQVLVRRPFRVNPVGTLAFYLYHSSFWIPEWILNYFEETKFVSDGFGPYPHVVKSIQKNL